MISPLLSSSAGTTAMLKRLRPMAATTAAAVPRLNSGLRPFTLSSRGVLFPSPAIADFRRLHRRRPSSSRTWNPLHSRCLTTASKASWKSFRGPWTNYERTRLHMSTVQSTLMCGLFCNRKKGLLSVCCTSQLPTMRLYSTYGGSSMQDQNISRFRNLKDRKIVPHCDPPSVKDVNLLHKFIERSHKLMVLTGAGLSTESGIPDYRSPHGAYSTGFKPITHQEFVRSIRSRRRYWARSYAGWIRFISAQPNAAHHALASLENVGRINYMVTQNVDRLHHGAGSDPLELHGTVYSVVCLECGNSIDRHSFQDMVKDMNPKWAAAIENLESGYPGSDKSFGMQQRPDADIEIDAKFWEEEFEIPHCEQCGGMLKPDVVFFGDNVPKDRADKAREAARECDSFLIIGSSVMTMSAFRIVRTAYEAGAPVAVVNIGETRADEFVSLKINARCGEILPRVFQMGSLSVPSVN